MVKKSHKTISFQRAKEISQEMKINHKTVVLVGGVFDILHFGHIHFLQEAKKRGDILFIALEPDSKVKKVKGNIRPIHSEDIRAYVLSALEAVDYVFILPKLSTDAEYEEVVRSITPSIIAVTAGDPLMETKKNHALKVGGKLLVVTAKIPTPSTSTLLKLLSLE